MVLEHKVFFSERPSATRTGPTGSDHSRRVPTSSTLIYGQRDAVLVDTQLTIKAAKDLADWVIASGRNLVANYITHAHGHHHFGSAILLEKFPSTVILATPEVAASMEKERTPERKQELWEKLFPGQIPDSFASAQPLQTEQFELESERLLVIRLGHTDCDETTALWVPSIILLVAGDCVYGNTHPYMGESGSLESRLAWAAALDKLSSLNAKVVIGGPSDPNSSFGPESISETKAFFEHFNRVADESDTAEEIYAAVMDRYPKRLNPGSLWSGAALAKQK